MGAEVKLVWGLAVCAVLWVCAAWNSSQTGQSLLFGHKPHLLLALMFFVAVRIRPGLAAVLGLLVAWLEGGASGANLTAYGLSRVSTGFLVSLVASSGIEVNWLTTAASVTIGTAVAQVILLFLAPPPDIGAFLAATIFTAIYNGVIAGFLSLALRKVLEKQVD